MVFQRKYGQGTRWKWMGREVREGEGENIFVIVIESDAVRGRRCIAKGILMFHLEFTALRWFFSTRLEVWLNLYDTKQSQWLTAMVSTYWKAAERGV